jgi:hypothetical protein
LVDPSLLKKAQQHCPSTAYDYCCQWYTLSQTDKKTIVSDGTLVYFLPWTSNCGASGPFDSPAQIEGVVKDVDDVCACTLKHQVGVKLPNEYAAITALTPEDPVCEQHFV